MYWAIMLATQAHQHAWRISMLTPMIAGVGVTILNFGVFLDPYRNRGFIVPGLLLCTGLEVAIVLAFALVRLSNQP